MNSSSEARIEAIRRDPDFADLVATRSRFARILSVLMLLIYFGFIMLVAFGKSILAVPLVGGGVTTIGIPIGVGVIVSAFVLTGLYVRRANGAYDAITARIAERAARA